MLYNDPVKPSVLHSIDKVNGKTTLTINASILLNGKYRAIEYTIPTPAEDWEEIHVAQEDVANKLKPTTLPTNAPPDKCHSKLSF
jgi:hypothetical protein